MDKPDRAVWLNTEIIEPSEAIFLTSYVVPALNDMVVVEVVKNPSPILVTTAP